MIAEDDEITPQNCVLDGFTVRDGFSLGAEPGFENGGAFCIFNNASPRIDRCTIINNGGLEGAQPAWKSRGSFPDCVLCSAD